MGTIVETVRPSNFRQDTSGGGYVLDGANAYDQNVATYSRVIAENAGQYGSQIVDDQADDSFPSARTSVILRLALAKFGWTAGDFAWVFFRARHADVWTPVAGYGAGDLGTSITWKDIDVTAIAGSAPSSGFEATVVFSNDAGFPPLPIDP